MQGRIGGMRKLAIWSIGVLLLLTLTGCGKCEHEFDNGLITKEPTCSEEGEETYTCIFCKKAYVESIPIIEHNYREDVTKEPTFDEEGEKTFTCESCGDLYVEHIPAIDKLSYAQNIYDQMIEYNNDEEYMNALMISIDVNIVGETKGKYKVIALGADTIKDHVEYFKQQLQYGIENKDYNILKVFSFYYLYIAYDDNIGFDKDQLQECVFVDGMQGEYMVYENIGGNEQVIIDGFNVKIGEVEYTCDYNRGYIFENAPELYREMLCFDKGIIERAAVEQIKITYEDGTSIKYISSEGKEAEEQKTIAEEKERQDYLANEPKIGMTTDEVKASNWGNPQKINKTTYEWGTTEQWCYPNNEYIYFEDGIVTAIQETD